MKSEYKLRKATLEERPAIEELIAASARGLSRADYSEQQIEAALATVFGVDTDLIIDGTYFVADTGEKLIGCGGWSKRKNLFGGDRFATRDSGQLDPNSEPAKIRAFFVHPDFARQGIARAILEACESEARIAGFRALELMSTLPGIPLYRALGYEGDERIEYEFGGVMIPLVPMRKQIGPD
jgi:GNAT superfamily N-acetyltransferase